MQSCDSLECFRPCDQDPLQANPLLKACGRKHSSNLRLATATLKPTRKPKSRIYRSLWFIWIHLDHDGPCRPPSVAAETFRLTTLAHLLLQSAQHGSERPEESPFSVALRPISGERLGAARHRAGTPSPGTRREFIQEVYGSISEGINVKKWCENTDRYRSWWKGTSSRSASSISIHFNPFHMEVS